MSQEEIMNSVYQESQYDVSLYDADSVVSQVKDKEEAEKKKGVSEMIHRINAKVDEFYKENGWVALSVDIPMTSELSRNSEWIKEVENCLIQMNWNVRIENEGVYGEDAKFVIKPKNWFYNKKDQNGKRGKQKPSFLTTFGIILIAVIVVGAFIKG